MSDNQKSFECTIVCWCIAAVVGFVAMAMLYMMADFDGNQAVFTGGLIGLLLGIVLSLFICRGQKSAADLASDEKPAQRYAREAAEDKARREGGSAASASAAGHAEAAPAATSAAPAAASTSAAAVSAAPAAAAGAAVQPSKALPGQAELADKKGDWKYEGGDAAGSDAPKKAPKAVPAGETAAPAVTPEVTSADVEEAKPATLYTSAPADGADDLKLISGVGPKLEQTLNELGIYKFEQVAAWGPTDIAWVDNRLRFKGRIERDDWMSQAKILAEGGETEFSARKKK